MMKRKSFSSLVGMKKIALLAFVLTTIFGMLLLLISGGLSEYNVPGFFPLMLLMMIISYGAPNLLFLLVI